MKANSAGATGTAGGVIFAVGVFSLAAQTLLFRRFLGIFEGHELGVAWFFGTWLFWVGVGAWLARGDSGWRSAWIRRFEWICLLYIPAYVAQIALIDHSRALAGVRPYELFPLLRMLPVALLANAPVSLCTGFLFPVACVWASRPGRIPVARVFMWESAGGFAGGAGVTLLLADGVCEETAVLLAALVLACVIGLYRLSLRDRLGAALIPLAAAAPLVLGVDRAWEDAVNRQTWKRILPAESYQGSFTTPQAKYLYGEYDGQFNVLAWQSVADSVPSAAASSQILASLMAQNPEARRFLVVGPGSYAICMRLLGLPQAESVTWIDPDPDYPRELLRALPRDLAGDARRLKMPHGDVRRHLQEAPDAYDLVVLNLPSAATLALNRYMTREFYELVRRRLAPSGVLGVRVAGGENVMGDERVNVGASAFHTLGSVFRHLAIKPGDETWIIGSDGDRMSEAPAVLRDRWKAVPGGAALYPPEGLMSQYPPDRIEFQRASYRAAVDSAPAGLLLNTDRQPRALVHSLLLAAREAGGTRRLAGWLRQYAAAGMPIVPMGIALYALLRLAYRSRAPGARGAVSGPADRVFEDYVLVLSTGAVAMSAGLALMLMYQSEFGSLFLHMGLMSSVFMLGLAGGSIICASVGVRSYRGAMLLVAGGLIAQAAGLVALRWLPADTSRSVFVLLCALNGLLSGIYVPAAAASLRCAGVGDRTAGAFIELADHLGGCIGSLVVGLLLIPVFGVSYALAILAALLVINLLPLIRGGRGGRSPEVPADWVASAVRPAGYALFGVAAFLLASSLALHRPGAGGLRPAFARAAATMAGDSTLTEQRHVRADGTTIEYFSAAAAAGSTPSYVFSTEHLAPDVPGYGGPVVLAVMVDQNGALLDLRLIRTSETPAYVDTLSEWFRSLVGQSLFESDALAGIDAVSGATVSSVAIRSALRQSGPLFARDVLRRDVAAPAVPPSPRAVDPRVGVLIALASVALVARRFPSPRVRWAMALAVVPVAGFLLNIQYSLSHVLALLGGVVPPAGWNVAFVLVVGVPLLVLLAGNVYCGHLCPFGLLQEMMGALRPASIRTEPDRATWRRTRLVKYVVLVVLLVLFALTRELRLASNDPLVAVFSRGRSGALAALAAALLGLSFFYPRFWCRTICPAGTFLSLLSGARLLARLRPPVVPARCAFGVTSERDPDCLCCDRCRWRGPGAPGAARLPATGERRRTVMFVACVAAAAVLVLAQAALTLRVARGGESRAMGAAGGRMRDVDMPKLRLMIREGVLSDREAWHYKTLLPAGASRAEAPSNR